MYVNRGGGGDLFYVYSDNLGSILTVTNGTNTYNQSFDAWGNYRNPTDGSYTNLPTNPAWLYRGFTGHEHLPQFQLINANGRLYDPLVNSFLSPDPALQNPANTQNYNRYSYCLNNPLKYTDPSGNLYYVSAAMVEARAAAYMQQMALNEWEGAFNNALTETDMGYINGSQAALAEGDNFSSTVTLIPFDPSSGSTSTTADGDGKPTTSQTGTTGSGIPYINAATPNNDSNNPWASLADQYNTSGSTQSTSSTPLFAVTGTMQTTTIVSGDITPFWGGIQVSNVSSQLANPSSVGVVNLNTTYDNNGGWASVDLNVNYSTSLFGFSIPSNSYLQYKNYGFEVGSSWGGFGANSSFSIDAKNSNFSFTLGGFYPNGSGFQQGPQINFEFSPATILGFGLYIYSGGTWLPQLQGQ